MYGSIAGIDEGSVTEGSRALEKRFERILKEYGPAISRLAASYERVVSVREELVQEIALAIWQSLAHFRGECSERTFLFRVAHNRALSHVARRKPAPAVLQELEGSEEPIDPRLGPDEQTAQRQQYARLMSGIQSLAVGQRQIIVLMLEGLSYAEIADVLGISENNVAVRLNRARTALKSALGGAIGHD